MDKRKDIIDTVKKYKMLVIESNLLNNIEQVFLFGSFAKGNPHKDSDIDVAFVINHFEGDFFKIIPPIHRLTEKIDFRIEPHIIVRDSDYAGFLNEIKHTGIEID
jgi:predicted nucleotidyltransferase